MKKKMLTLMTVLMMAAGSAFAQVIITDEDVNHNRATRDAEEFGVMVPMQKFDGDQWKVAPLGNGILLLAGLGAAYLVKKRKK
jgi:hypothetical protein